jgi:hypothetical protein
MSDYNINFSEKSTSGNSNQQEPKYALAFFAGLGVAVLIAIILAVVAISAEKEYDLLVVIGAIVVGLPIRALVPSRSVGGAVIGAICCPATFLLYQFMNNIFGYYYEDSSMFWIGLVCSILYGAYIGYNKD